MAYPQQPANWSDPTGTPSGPPAEAPYDPSRDLGPLFADVQRARVFADGKTFVDARPLRAPAEIGARYLAARGPPSGSVRPNASSSRYDSGRGSARSS